MNKEDEKEVTLKSAININQKFDLKTSSQSNIYKGRNYKDFNKLLNSFDRINLSHIEIKKKFGIISEIEIKNFRDEELSYKLEGSKINYMNILLK